ncbi:GNAT family N-acetyltransferase [Halobacterium salinarum]|uniref:GNAT family N-acetyltransferase n=1 Tax=Halobacterium TaxID=2239 RepID=UPI002556A454|nr:GNAT family N-acetyltransferase [Halobacterium salinarum]MDL0126863.1 GNAT family N-acetyltransferase [Halobacterium salinarum]MDL0134247.1 GNAT family N-acetyltransferase [Halobacterium salinarum]MDL0139939.1 GNAT family N-acetyltransferase [Halobacterium salinarum]
MRYAVLGDHHDGPTLLLDWEAFSYAGKFVMSNTGKAVAYEGAPLAERGDDWPPDARAADDPVDDVVGAVSFNEDRTDAHAAWLRYVTVRGDRRGAGIGARLCAFAAAHLLGDHECVRIAVNNPFAYEALHKAGFGFTGEETGIAELVLERPCEHRAAGYQDGLDRYRERDLSPEEAAFLDRKRGASPPARVEW